MAQDDTYSSLAEWWEGYARRAARWRLFVSLCIVLTLIEIAGMLINGHW